jgi:hypothetical protein
MTIPTVSERLLAFIAVTIVVTASLGIAFAHDYPAGITRIAEINTGAVAPGENVTIRCRVVSVLVLLIGFGLQYLMLSDGPNNLTADWSKSQVEVGWVIVTRGTVESNRSLSHLIWLERVWFFVWL